MKLQLRPHITPIYISDNWNIKIKRMNISSVTPTIIPNIGYGGYGWALSIFHSTIKLDNIKIGLYRNNILINTYKPDKKGKCIMSPDGGTPDEYRIMLYKVKK